MKAPVIATSTSAATADEAVSLLFRAHSRDMVRVAVLLVDEVGQAEELVQDAFVKLHQSWDRLHDQDKALAYLRTTVVNLARSHLRRRGMLRQRLNRLAPVPDTTDPDVAALVRRTAMQQAIERLPRRQREVLVLRYFSDLSEEETAEALGLSCGAVKAYAARGRAGLAELMRETFGA